jgi:hypothetical protein
LPYNGKNNWLAVIISMMHNIGNIFGVHRTLPKCA